MGAEAPADPATAAAAAAVEVATTGAASAKGRTTHATESERYVDMIYSIHLAVDGLATELALAMIANWLLARLNILALSPKHFIFSVEASFLVLRHQLVQLASPSHALEAQANLWSADVEGRKLDGKHNPLPQANDCLSRVCSLTETELSRRSIS